MLTPAGASAGALDGVGGSMRLLESLRGLGRARLRPLACPGGSHGHPLVPADLCGGPPVDQDELRLDRRPGGLAPVGTPAHFGNPEPAGRDAGRRPHRGARGSSSLQVVARGLGYRTLGLASELIGALAASALIGLGTAVWHLPAMGTLSTRFPERRATALAVHGVGARVSNTLTPLAIGALLVAFAWGDVVRVQRLPAILVALVRWRGLAS